MPQLDQFTYFSQIVWLTLSFLVYYVVVVHSSLPKLSRILKSRARFLSHQTEKATQDQDKVNDTLVTDCVAKSAHYLHESVSSAQAWCSSCIVHFQNTDCVKANQSYLKTLSELTLAQVMWKTVRAPLSLERVLFKRFTQQMSPKPEQKTQTFVTKVTSRASPRVSKKRQDKLTSDSLVPKVQDKTHSELTSESPVTKVTSHAKKAKQKHTANSVVSKNSSASKSKNKGKTK